MSQSEVDESWDPLGGDLPPGAESYRQSREADNVLGSYFHASDLLAEALQNAADAIDDHSDQDAEAPRVIELDFDVDRERFSVSDTGTGMSRQALDIVFQPNITMKAGPLARPTSRTWRGEKGVGLSFLLFSCDELQIRTCDGENRYDAKIQGAGSWAKDPDSAAPIEHELRVSGPDAHFGSERYTIITLSRIHTNLFDKDLFSMSIDELEWVLRTRTAVGNTAFLFEDLGFDQPDDIEVSLLFREAGDSEKTLRTVPYQYATPEDLLVLAEEKRVIDPVQVYDFEELEGLSAREIRRKMDGAAVRYVASFSTPTKNVAVYMFAMAGDALNDILSDLANEADVSWVPKEWQGFWVATRDMPTGVALRGGVLPTRGYEQRTFGLLQLDDLKLDVGRKSLHGRTVAMFKNVLKEVWNTDMRWIVERIPRRRTGKGVGVLEIERRIRQANQLEDLGSTIPFSKVPDRRTAVAAVFHEFLGSGDAKVPSLHGLTTEIFTDTDLLATNGHSDSEGNAKAVHVVFGLDQIDLLEIFDSDRDVAPTVNMAVVWDLRSSGQVDADVNLIEVETAVDGPYEATHLLHFGGLGGRESPLPVIVLSESIGVEG